MKKPLNEMCCYDAAIKEGYSDDEIQVDDRLCSSLIWCRACQEKSRKEALRERGKAVLGSAWKPAEETKPSAMKKPLNEICCYDAAKEAGYTDEEIRGEDALTFAPMMCKTCRSKEGNADPKPSAMDEAAKVVNGDRQEDYGDAKESFERIAALWSPLLGTPVTAKQVALCMIALTSSDGPATTSITLSLTLSTAASVWRKP